MNLNSETCGFELVTREFELVARGFELVTCGFELVTHNSYFTFPRIKKGKNFFAIAADSQVLGFHCIIIYESFLD